MTTEQFSSGMFSNVLSQLCYLNERIKFGLMNLINLPIFILLFAIVYLSIVYGLLKMAETQKRNVNLLPSDRTQDIN